MGSVSAFYCHHVDGVCIIMIQNKHVFITLIGSSSEFSRLVEITFGVTFFRAKNGTHDVVRFYVIFFLGRFYVIFFGSDLILRPLQFFAS